MMDTLTPWLHAAPGLATLQWSVLLAVAAVAGHLVQRRLGLPKILGYSVVGTLAGLVGFGGAPWPLQGPGLYLLELGVALVLFEAGGRVPLRWFRHNPMVLVQSLVESAATYGLVAWTLSALGADEVAHPLALVAMAASPTVLAQVVRDSRASGPVTERAMVLATLSTLYTLALCSAQARLMESGAGGWWAALAPMVAVLALSLAMGALLAFTVRLALRAMHPGSENTAMLLLALIASCATLATHVGGSAPLAALIGGVLLKQAHPRPWAWPQQMGTASSLLVMLSFVLVSLVAAQAPWEGTAASLVLALVAARALAKLAGVALANPGSGARFRQAVAVGCAMLPMSAVALLMLSQFTQVSATLGPALTMVGLPAILLMELLGAVGATVALRRAGEGRPTGPATPKGGTAHG